MEFVEFLKERRWVQKVGSQYILTLEIKVIYEEQEIIIQYDYGFDKKTLKWNFCNYYVFNYDLPEFQVLKMIPYIEEDEWFQTETKKIAKCFKMRALLKN